MIETDRSQPSPTPFCLSRKRSAEELVESLRSLDTPPLIVVHGPSGTGKTALARFYLPREIAAMDRSDGGEACCRSVAGDESATEIARCLVDGIIDHHPDLRSRRSTTLFREKMRRTVERSPAEAAEKLRGMLLPLGASSYDSAHPRLFLALDGVDRFFGSRLSCGGEPSLALAGSEFRSLADLLARLAGIPGLLVMMTCRSWIIPEIDRLFADSSLPDNALLKHLLSNSTLEETRPVLGGLVASPGPEIDPDHPVSRQIASWVTGHPPCLHALPGVLAELSSGGADTPWHTDFGVRCAEVGGLPGTIAKLAERFYLRQESNRKLAVKEIVNRLSSLPGTIPMRDMMRDDELWRAALGMTEHGILCLSGESIDGGVFSTTHPEVFSCWDRARNWAGDTGFLGISRLREFDEKALTWELGDRCVSLLLGREPDLDCARTVLRDSDLSSQIAPLTRQYLRESIRPRLILPRLLRQSLWPAACGLGLLLLTALVLTRLPENGARPEVSPAPPVAESEPPTNQPEQRVSSLNEGTLNAMLSSAEEIASLSRQIPEKLVPLPEEKLLPRDLLLDLPISPDRPSIPIPSDVPTLTARIAELAEASSASVEKDSPDHLSTPELIPSALSASALANAPLPADADCEVIVARIAAATDAGLVGVAVDGLALFHAKSHAGTLDPANPDPDQLGRIVASLEQIARLQGDTQAVSAAEKLQLPGEDLDAHHTGLRMLMARIALNSDREAEAVAFLAQTPIETETNEESVRFLEAALGWHFDRTGRAREGFRSLLAEPGKTSP